MMSKFINNKYFVALIPKSKYNTIISLWREKSWSTTIDDVFAWRCGPWAGVSRGRPPAPPVSTTPRPARGRRWPPGGVPPAARPPTLAGGDGDRRPISTQHGQTLTVCQSWRRLAWVLKKWDVLGISYMKLSILQSFLFINLVKRMNKCS